MNIEQFKKANKHEGDMVALNGGKHYWLQSWDDEFEVCNLIQMTISDEPLNYDKDVEREHSSDYMQVNISRIKYITSPDAKYTDQLRDITIYKLTLSFGYMVSCAPDDVRDKIDNLTFAELLSLIELNERNMKKGCDAGISTDVVARTLWENIEFPEKVK